MRGPCFYSPVHSPFPFSLRLPRSLFPGEQEQEMGNMERGTTWNKVEQSGTRSVFCRISLDGGGIRETGDGDLAREEVISVMVLIERKKTFFVFVPNERRVRFEDQE